MAPTRGELCGFLNGFDSGHSTKHPLLGGVYDPDIMSDVGAQFEPFERCCMAILFVGGQGKTMLHPTSPPLLLVKSVDRGGDHPVAPSLCVRRINAMIFLGRG